MHGQGWALIELIAIGTDRERGIWMMVKSEREKAHGGQCNFSCFILEFYF
jgi:hypothetical protein